LPYPLLSGHPSLLALSRVSFTHLYALDSARFAEPRAARLIEHAELADEPDELRELATRRDVELVPSRTEPELREQLDRASRATDRGEQCRAGGEDSVFWLSPSARHSRCDPPRYLPAGRRRPFFRG